MTASSGLFSEDQGRSDSGQEGLPGNAVSARPWLAWPMGAPGWGGGGRGPEWEQGLSGSAESITALSASLPTLEREALLETQLAELHTWLL